MPTSYKPQDEIKPGVFSTPLPGVFFLPFTRHTDQRGFYAELFRAPELNELLEQPFTIKQTNLSFSVQNVIRGFHAENWRKFLTILTGTAFCAFADFRTDSPTFGQVLTVSVGEQGLSGSFFLPAGIGNSFCVTQGPCNYLYAVDQLYKERDTSGDIAISLFDPDLAVEWPLPREAMIVSQRDASAVTFRDRFPQYQKGNS